MRVMVKMFGKINKDCVEAKENLATYTEHTPHYKDYSVGGYY